MTPLSVQAIPTGLLAASRSYNNKLKNSFRILRVDLNADLSMYLATPISKTIISNILEKFYSSFRVNFSLIWIHGILAIFFNIYVLGNDIAWSRVLGIFFRGRICVFEGSGYSENYRFNFGAASIFSKNEARNWKNKVSKF